MDMAGIMAGLRPTAPRPAPRPVRPASAPRPAPRPVRPAPAPRPAPRPVRPAPAPRPANQAPAPRPAPRPTAAPWSAPAQYPQQQTSVQVNQNRPSNVVNEVLQPRRAQVGGGGMREA